MTDNTTPERQSLRQVIAQTSKAVRTGPIELRRAAEVAASATMTDNTTPERVERWTVDQPDYRCPHCGSDDIGPLHAGDYMGDDYVDAYWCPDCSREIPEPPKVEVIPVAPLIRWLDEQAKATMDAHRNFRSDYDEGRFDAFETVEAHIEGRDTHE